MLAAKRMRAPHRAPLGGRHQRRIFLPGLYYPEHVSLVSIYQSPYFSIPKDIQMAYLRGLRYELEKQKEGGLGANQHTKQEDPQIEDPPQRTSERLATQYKVSRGTIERDASYARDVNAIAAVAETQGSRIVMETEGKLGRKERKALATSVASSRQTAQPVVTRTENVRYLHTRREGQYC
jgi:hypothetical protein